MYKEKLHLSSVALLLFFVFSFSCLPILMDDLFNISSMTQLFVLSLIAYK